MIGKILEQILEGRELLKKNAKIELNIPVVANSTAAFFEDKMMRPSWETDLKYFGFAYNIDQILAYIKKEGFKNVIIFAKNFVTHFFCVGNFSLTNRDKGNTRFG